MNLYAVVYLKGHLMASTLLLPGTTTEQCVAINTAYAKQLPAQAFVKSGKVKITDVRLACERR